MLLCLEDTFVVGVECYFDSVSPDDRFGVSFEDNGETGYFYAILMKPEQNLVDGLHIYNVADVSDGHIPSNIKIAWTDDGNVASLLLNNYCHAVFDFNKKAGYCRNGFPPNRSGWARIIERSLTDDMFGLIFKNYK